jgi:hypothetical protein
VPNSQTNVDVMTAVEWLEEQYYYSDGKLTRQDFEQAKEMEKDQICASYVYGSAYGIDIDNNLSPQNYYNEKFNHESNN